MAPGWRVLQGVDIDPGASGAERFDYDEVVLEAHLRNALSERNPDRPEIALQDSLTGVTHRVILAKRMDGID